MGKWIKTKSIKNKIFSIILVFAFGMLMVLGIISYGIMSKLSQLVPLIRGERIANAIPVRDAEVYYMDYLYTGNKEAKKGFYKACSLAKGGGVYGDILKEDADPSKIALEIKEALKNAKYPLNALTDNEVDKILNLGFTFRKVGRIKKLLEIAESHGERVSVLKGTFDQVVDIKQSSIDENTKKRRLIVIDAKMKGLFNELYSFGAMFSKYTGETAYWIVNITTLLISCLIILFIVIGSIIGFMISNSITQPLAKLMKASKEVAKGNLDYRADAKSDDEIGELANAFNQMTAELKESRKHLEDYNKRLEEEVKKRTQELKDAQAQIIQSAKMSAVGQLGAGVAHELNNPLGGVLGYAQFILEKLKNPDFGPNDFKSCQKYIESIEKESARCKNIVANLLKFSRRPITFKSEAVNIKEALEETLGIVGHQLKLKNINVTTEIQPDLGKVMGIVNQLQQIFTNLILNAQQAMPDGGELKVKAANVMNEETKAPSHVKMEFSDTGDGIRPEVISEIFDPFFTTKQKDKGTGLGLSVVYEIIQKHHGKIDVASEVGKGTTFTITLPVINKESEASS